MKKTIFISTFNINLNLLLGSTLTGILGWLLDLLSGSLSQLSLTFLELSLLANQGSVFAYNTSSLLLTLLTMSLSFEIAGRIRLDKISNYPKSIYHTFKLRHFLIQQEPIKKVNIIDGQTITSYNPINQGFNRNARKCVVDIREDEVSIFVKVPRDQQSQQILNDLMSQLKEEVANQLPDYYFSAPQRVRNQLWLVGKKR